MSVTLIMAAALAASSASPSADTPSSGRDPGVAYNELSHNETEAAIARIRASGQIENRDPAALINLGAAYARLGQRERALDMYRSAIASPDRYDLRLADGRWMDSRAAARLAVAALEKSQQVVLR